MSPQFLQFSYINHVTVAIQNIHKDEVTMTIIVIAHGGVMEASNRQSGGAQIFLLPLDEASPRFVEELEYE